MTRQLDQMSTDRRKLLKGIGLSAAGVGLASAHAVGAQGPTYSLAAAQDVKPGGTLMVGLNQESATIDPHLSRDAAGNQIKGLIYSQLIKYYYDRELVPDLAESYEQTDDVTYEFKLRQGVKFHDGAELTSADVVASYERILNKDVGAYLYPFIGDSVESVTAPDDYTVVFKLNGPFTAFLPTLGLPGNSIAQKAKIDEGVDFTIDVVGSGPFKLASRTEGVETRLEKNPDYFLEGLPYLDEIVFRPIFDDPARMNALFSGDVDLITYPNWASMERIENDPALQLQSNKSDGFVFIHFRVDRPPFDDVKIRQAISYAINRDAIIATATSGRGQASAGGFIPPWMEEFYNPDLAEKYAYDPEKAKQLIQEAGAEGLEIEFTSWPADTELFGRPSVVVANMLNELGLKVTLRPQPVAEWAQTRAEGTYQMFMDGNLYGVADPDFLTSYFQTGARIPAANQFSDEQIDAWLDEGRGMPNGDERAEVYRHIEERALDLMPITLLFYREQGEASQTYVQGHQYIGSLGYTNTLLEVWLDK